MNILLNTSIIAFISSIIGGYLPLRKNSMKHHRWMHHVDSLCDGMFLAIALTHLLPELFEHSSTHLEAIGYSLLALIIAAGIQLPSKKKQSQSFITILLFSHCLIEGIAVAVVQDSSLQATLSLAILAHKSVEAFVFFNLIARQNLSQTRLLCLLLIFSLLTPLGIIIGGYMNSFPHGISQLITALTCGTFLGISINCFLLKSCDSHSHHNKFWIVLGFAILAIIMGMAEGH